MQFCIARIPDWSKCSFQIHFVEIKASFDGWAVIGLHSTSKEMESRYCFQEFSAQTDVLVRKMKEHEEEMNQLVDDYMKAIKPAN